MFGGQFLNARYVDLSLRLINLAVRSEGNDILSFRSYFQSKGGTFLRHPVVDNKNADYLMSQNIFRNWKLTDELIYFWYKARRNVLPCYYTLSLWYPNQPTTCVLDGYHIESTAHVLMDARN